VNAKYPAAVVPNSRAVSHTDATHPVTAITQSATPVGTRKSSDRRDQVWIPHEMLYLKIMKVPVQDGIRDVPVSGVIAGVNDKVC